MRPMLDTTWCLWISSFWSANGSSSSSSSSSNSINNIHVKEWVWVLYNHCAELTAMDSKRESRFLTIWSLSSASFAWSLTPCTTAAGAFSTNCNRSTNLFDCQKQTYSPLQTWHKKVSTSDMVLLIRAVIKVGTNVLLQCSSFGDLLAKNER